MHLDISQHHMVAWECQAHWVRHTQFKRSWVSLIQKPPFSAGASSEQRDNMIFLLRQKSMPVKMLNAWLPNPSKHFLSKREMMEGARVGDLHVLCQSLGLYCAYCSPPKESFLLSIHPSMYLSPSIQPSMHLSVRFFFVVRSEETLFQRVLHADWKLPQHLVTVGESPRCRHINVLCVLWNPSCKWLQRAFLK